MARIRIWWTRYQFLRNIHMFADDVSDDKAQESWEAVRTLCENHERSRIRHIENDDGETEIEIAFWLQL